MEYISSVGRRKTSVARLYMKPGKGSFKINNTDLDKYFSSELMRLIVEQPLKSVNASDTDTYHQPMRLTVFIYAPKSI